MDSAADTNAEPGQPIAASPAATKTSALGLRFFLLALLTVGGLLGVSFSLACRPKTAVTAISTTLEGDNPTEGSWSKEMQELIAKHFRDWPAGKKPEIVLVLTGETHLYEEPCGCSFPQYGGLERRYWFLKMLRDQGVETIPLDLGDVYFNHYTPGRQTQEVQVKLKYRKIMEAYSVMEYPAVAVGKEEFRYPLLDSLAETLLNDKKTFSYTPLAANVQGRQANFVNLVGDAVLVGKKVKVGVAGTVGDSVSKEVTKKDPMIKFDPNDKIVPAILDGWKGEKPELRVLLYHGTEAEAKNLAKAIPDFDFVLCLSPDSEPPIRPTEIGKTQIVQVGHKGRYVGVAAFFRQPDNSLKLHYDPVRLGPEFTTPKGDDDKNPVIAVLDSYTKEVRERDLLSKYRQLTHDMQAQPGFANAAFVGSEKCKECHKNEFAVWDASKHAEAIKPLELAKRPANRQFDGECIVCHTTGFGYKTGYENEKKTPHLREVGCESCHGPASLHVANPKNAQFALALSPWKMKPNDWLPDAKVEERIDTSTCQKCHDSENDPKFKFAEYWWPSKKSKDGVVHGKGPAKRPVKEEKTK